MAHTVHDTGTDRLLTAEEFMELEQPEHRELVRGRVVALTPPGAEHGVVAANVASLIREFVRKHDLGRVSVGHTGHRIARDPDTVRGPDVGFVAEDRVPVSGVPKTYWDCAPNLAVEIVSPSDRWTRVESKTRDWLDGGTREVWLVVPELREIRIVTGEGAPRVLRAGDEITSAVLPGFRAAVDDVFD